MFQIDSRIDTTCFTLGDWPLSRILLKNEQKFPWFILVPRRANVQEIFHLPTKDRSLLMEEIAQLSSLINHYFSPDKINVGALGNIVPQLHIHLVARSSMDSLWPQGVWQADLNNTPYEQVQLNIIVEQFKQLIKNHTF